MTHWRIAAWAACLLGAGLTSGCSLGDAPDGQGLFKTQVIEAYDALAASPLNATPMANLLDTDYLDAGTTKGDILAALKGEADAVAASTEYSSFTQVRVSDVAISCSGAGAFCNVTLTYTNADADTVSVSHTTQIRLTDIFRLYGNQSRT